MLSNNTLRNILIWTLSATAIIPLLSWGSLFYPFIVLKVLFFRTIVVLAFSLFLILFALGKISINKGLIRKKIIWIPAILLISSYISALFGVDFSNSFWSGFNRMEGLLTLTHLVIYFYLLLFSFNAKNWRNFLYLISSVSVIVAISALLEGVGAVTFSPHGGRIGGTINNAAFLSSYLLFTAPITLYLALINIDKKKLFYVFLGGSLLSFFTIFASGTRGAVLGIAGALFVMILVSIKVISSKIVKKYLIGLMIIFLLLGTLGVVFKDKLADSNILIVRRMAQISFQDNSTLSRLFIWKETLPKAFESPIFGHGTENFEYIYNTIYDPSIVQEEWFDRSHNIYIDYLLNGGIVGFSLYILLLVALIYEIWKDGYKNHTRFFIFLFLVLAYMIQNFFVFDSINTLFLFFAVLAFWFSVGGDNSESKIEMKDNILLRSSIFTLVLLSITSLYFFQYKPLRANVLLSEGYTYQIVDLERSIYAWDTGISSTPQYKKDFGYQVYDSYYNKIKEQMSFNELETSFSHSVSILKGAIEKYPLDVRLRIYLAHILEDRPDGVALDEELFFETIENAIELSPNRKQSHYILANYYLLKISNIPPLSFEKEYFENAIEVLDSYSKIMPTFSEPKLILANILINNNETKRAEEYFNEGLSLYYQNPASAKRIVSYYLAKEDYISVEPFFEYIVAVDPTNVNLLFDLAHVYYFNGKIDDAKNTLLKIEKIDDSIFNNDRQFVNNLLGR